MLSFCSGNAERLALLLRELYRQRTPLPSREWSIIISADEATVGNLLAVDPRRKAWLLYWSIAEFGAEVLSREDSWMLLGVMRSSICKKIGESFLQLSPIFGICGFSRQEVA